MLDKALHGALAWGSFAQDVRHMIAYLESRHRSKALNKPEGSLDDVSAQGAGAMVKHTITTIGEGASRKYRCEADKHRGSRFGAKGAFPFWSFEGYMPESMYHFNENEKTLVQRVKESSVSLSKHLLWLHSQKIWYNESKAWEYTHLTSPQWVYDLKLRELSPYLVNIRSKVLFPSIELLLYSNKLMLPHGRTESYHKHKAMCLRDAAMEFCFSLANCYLA